MGPLGYLKNDPLGGILPTLYGCVCALAALTMGNLIQVQTVRESVQSLLEVLLHDPVSPVWTAAVTGLSVSLLVGFSLLGGAKRVGKTAAFLVPIMSILYILGAGAVIAVNYGRIPWAVSEIFRTALRPEAFLVGTARGVFTHEAGLGTAAVARIGRISEHPHREALGGVFEVFFDTNVLCTLTALAVLTSGVSLPFGNASVNSSLVIQAFSTLFGPPVSAGFLAFALLLFAFSSILSFALYGQLCIRLLFGRRAGSLYRFLFLLLCALGPLMETGLAWRISEYTNIFLALLHMAGLTPLLWKLSAKKSTSI